MTFNLSFISIMSLITVLPYHSFAQSPTLHILMIGAHPDDCDIKSGGTAALFAAQGHQVKFISVTNGDAGHMEMGGGILAKRRTAQAPSSSRPARNRPNPSVFRE